MATLTPEAKAQLSRTVRGLRERLLTDLRAAADGVYRLSVPVSKAGLAEKERILRQRLEDWLDEQARADRGKKESTGDARERHRLAAEKLAGATLLNRLVVIKHMEALEMLRPAVVTGGWGSPGYREFRDFAPALASGETEGYATLLRLLFDELAVDLPGLFGEVGISALFPIPAATLRAVVEALDDPGLDSAWTDDTTLGWVYQYWNDPEREALDAKLHAGGKVEPHEIASKTQMFTERYMVEWLLHNSLGQMWLATCRKHGWTPEVEADGTLDRLEERRRAWRAKREAGEVALDELMPIETPAEERWKYWVPQPMPEDSVEQAPESVRELKILDPACGSGHFLVIAFDLLVALYREEAGHRGEAWGDREIVESIAENNLHGIDIDPWAVQIAAAAVFLKTRKACPEAHPRRLNLVASNLRLSSLADDDPALVALRREIEAETGIPAGLTDTLVHALQGADHLGSLLRIDRAVEAAIQKHEAASQLGLFDAPTAGPAKLKPETGRRTLLDRLEGFLARHGSADDLGLRLRGEQLAAGVRFMRMVEEGSYDLVVGNPPYQGTSKMAQDRYVKKQYPRGKADLYSAFLERGLQLVQPGGVSALLTMRNWMFIKQYAKLRKWLLKSWDLRALGDFAIGAFDEVPNDVLSVAVSVFRRSSPGETTSVAQQPTPPADQSYDRARTGRKRAATLCHVGRYEFDPAALKVVPEWPLVYWWSSDFLSEYNEAPKLSERFPSRKGTWTSDNTRLLRRPHEISRLCAADPSATNWLPYVGGAKGQKWIDSTTEVLKWAASGLELKVLLDHKHGVYPQGTTHFFQRGIAFSQIGTSFSARAHRYAGAFGGKGSSVFPDDLANTLCAMNSSVAQFTLSSFNPGMGFELGDVARLALTPFANADDVFTLLEAEFGRHEAHREPSVEFRHPGPSPWRHAQDWAQDAVDRPEGAPLPPYAPVYDPEPPTDHLSFALGVALGRFGPNGEGILDPTKDPLDQALPAGICFLDASLDPSDRRDSLGHRAASPLRTGWFEHAPAIDPKTDLRTWLPLKFFQDVHRKMYENRPIHFPLSSRDRNFVAYVNIHRWTDATLQTLLADHLRPSQARLEGEIADLLEARNVGDRASRAKAEQRYAEVKRLHEELTDFIAKVAECAERGAPPPDATTPAREVDARFKMDLDDGVMINSAALWPLLEPQWKDPKKWWKELCLAKGRKDYDWSHLAARYFPTRVDEKCRKDPSLAVAHGCFWKYHPAKAYQWQLRLQDEIAPDFTLDEEDSGAQRAAFEREHPDQVEELIAAEHKRRERVRKKKAREEAKKAESDKPTVAGPLFAEKENT